jgi:predicted Fe-Mo cluster-binding NifX family protein
MRRVAIPCDNGVVSAHFGHAPQFALFDVDLEARQVRAETISTPPPHEPGALPVWLAEQGVQVVLAGGMGGRARQLLGQAGIEVVIGIAATAPRGAIEAYLRGALKAGDNTCDHGPGFCH